MIDSKPVKPLKPHKSMAAQAPGKPHAGIAGIIGEQCDDIEKKRVEQTDKMRLLLLKLGRTTGTKIAKT